MIETGRDKRCTVCGERPASASWVCSGDGGMEFAVCVVCATNKLPQLIADAVFSSMQGARNDAADYSKKAFNDVSENYYRALSHAALSGMIKPLIFNCLKCNKQQTVSDARVSVSAKKEFVECVECGYAHEVSWALTEDVTAVDDEFIQSISINRAERSNTDTVE